MYRTDVNRFLQIKLSSWVRKEIDPFWMLGYLILQRKIAKITISLKFYSLKKSDFMKGLVFAELNYTIAKNYTTVSKF